MPSQYANVEKFENNYFRYHNSNVHSYCVSVCIMSEPLIIAGQIIHLVNYMQEGNWWNHKHSYSAEYNALQNSNRRCI